MSKSAIRKLKPSAGEPLSKSAAKLREIVVLLASRSKDDKKYGGVKLNKLLFYCDFMAYANLGQPITGEAYAAYENGPALKNKTLLWRQLEKQKDIAIRREPTMFGTERQISVALREPNVSLFSTAELDLIYRVLELCRDMDGSELSEITHRFPGWQLAREKEIIPYGVALIASRPASASELRTAAELQTEFEEVA